MLVFHSVNVQGKKMLMVGFGDMCRTIHSITVDIDLWVIVFFYKLFMCTRVQNLYVFFVQMFLEWRRCKPVRDSTNTYRRHSIDFPFKVSFTLYKTNFVPTFTGRVGLLGPDTDGLRITLESWQHTYMYMNKYYIPG